MAVRIIYAVIQINLLVSPPVGCGGPGAGQSPDGQRDGTCWQPAGRSGGEHRPDQLRQRRQRLQGWIHISKLFSLHQSEVWNHLLFVCLFGFSSQGLVSNLTLGGVPLSGWTMFSLSIDEAVRQGLLGHQAEAAPPPPAAPSPPAFYRGSFVIPDGIPDLPQDSYVQLSNWTKARDAHERQTRFTRSFSLYRETMPGENEMKRPALAAMMFFAGAPN